MRLINTFFLTLFFSVISVVTVSAKDDYKLVLPASSDILATRDGGTVELKQLLELLKVDKKLMKIFIADSLDILETVLDEP